jgi:hypothetical protein
MGLFIAHYATDFDWQALEVHQGQGGQLIFQVNHHVDCVSVGQLTAISRVFAKAIPTRTSWELKGKGKVGIATTKYEPINAMKGPHAPKPSVR